MQLAPESITLVVSDSKVLLLRLTIDTSGLTLEDIVLPNKLALISYNHVSTSHDLFNISL